MSVATLLTRTEPTPGMKMCLALEQHTFLLTPALLARIQAKRPPIPLGQLGDWRVTAEPDFGYVRKLPTFPEKQLHARIHLDEGGYLVCLSCSYGAEGPWLIQFSVPVDAVVQ